MKSLPWILALACFTASLAQAGPNAGGVLVVHDTGLGYSTDDMGPPFGGPIPTGCNDVDTEAPFSSGSQGRIWKVYAAFPSASSPRLQGLAWGMDITPMGSGYVVTVAGGLVNPGDFEVTQDGWPRTNGASIGQSFPASGTKTSLMNEVYWFAGYAYGGPAGTDVQYFCARPHRVQASVFVDDAPIRNSDPIAGYGCLGFGGPGHAPCPVLPPPTGSCCATTGACTVTQQEGCSGAWTAGITCSPNPCPQPTGACCSNGTCWVTDQSTCSSIRGAWTMFGTCVPNDCPPPPGRCCYLDGSCTETIEAQCGGGVWEYHGTCDPNPCIVPGACCDYDTRECALLTPAECTRGSWVAGACGPVPCFSTPVERKSWGQIKNLFR